MRYRKEKPLLGQCRIQVARMAARADGGSLLDAVDLDAAHARHVDQQATVADVVLRPAVTARAHGDLEAVLACLVDGCNDIAGVVGLNYDVRASPRVARIETGTLNGSVKALVAASQGDAFSLRFHHFFSLECLSIIHSQLPVGCTFRFGSVRVFRNQYYNRI